MKNYILGILVILLIDLTFQRCANPGRPSGGPKDTIPPILINSYPLTGTTNFKDKEFVLEFSEYVTADQLRQQLIITPKTDITFKSIAKRNKLIIKLDEVLSDSITYNFNFADGVTDITEKNPAINLSIAFSTGPIIDSLYVQGVVEELLTKEPGAGFLVGLYPFSDTLNYFTQNPMYFTKANEQGIYSINYIKSGNYKIIAFEDNNGNYLLDPESEQHGFLEKTITLDSSKQLDPIRCILQNVKPIELINARPTGPYVEIKFNKTPDNYSIEPGYLNHIITGDKKDIIRIYKPDNVSFQHSIQSIINVSDSLGNTISDTLKIAFLESNRKLSNLNITAIPNSIVLKDSFKISFRFNKPIIQFDQTKFFFKADSIFNYNIVPSSKINHNKTQYDLNFNIDKDSLIYYYESSLPKDTIPTDTLAKKGDIVRPQLSKPPLKIIMDPNAFISVESDSTKSQEFTIKQSPPKTSATLKLQITTDYTQFIVQLIDESATVRYSKRNQKNNEFKNIKSGTYSIRVLIDEDNNGFYSYGNLLQNQEPEPIYLHPTPTSVRENWIVELGISF